MDGHAADLYSVVDRLLLGVESRERGQQRRMDVEDAVGERLDERRTDEAHEAGQADKPDVAGAQLLDESAVICVAGRKGAMRETYRLDLGRPRSIQSSGILAVGNDDRNRRVQVADGNRVNQRLEIAATTGDENPETPVHT